MNDNMQSIDARHIDTTHQQLAAWYWSHDTPFLPVKNDSTWELVEQFYCDQVGIGITDDDIAPLFFSYAVARLSEVREC